MNHQMNCEMTLALLRLELEKNKTTYAVLAENSGLNRHWLEKFNQKKHGVLRADMIEGLYKYLKYGTKYIKPDKG